MDTLQSFEWYYIDEDQSIDCILCSSTGTTTCPSNVCSSCSCSPDTLIIPPFSLSSYAVVEITEKMVISQEESRRKRAEDDSTIVYAVTNINVSLWGAVAINFPTGSQFVSSQSSLTIEPVISNPNTCPPSSPSSVLYEWTCEDVSTDSVICPCPPPPPPSSSSPSLTLENADQEGCKHRWELTIEYCSDDDFVFSSSFQVEWTPLLTLPVQYLFALSSCDEEYLSTNSLFFQIELSEDFSFSTLPEDGELLYQWSGVVWRTSDTDTDTNSVDTEEFSLDLEECLFQFDSSCVVQFGGNSDSSDGDLSVNITSPTIILLPGTVPPHYSLALTIHAVVVVDGEVADGWTWNNVTSCIVRPVIPPYGGDCEVPAQFLPVTPFIPFLMQCTGWIGRNLRYQYNLDSSSLESRLVPITNLVGSVHYLSLPGEEIPSSQRLIVLICNDQGACSESKTIEVNVLAVATDSDTEELTESYTQEVLDLVNTGNSMLAANVLFSIVTSPSPDSFLEESVSLLETITDSILEFKSAEELTSEEANIILSTLAVLNLTDENAGQTLSLLSDVSVAQNYDIQLTGLVLDEVVSLQPEGDGDSDDGLTLDDYLAISDNMEVSFASDPSNCGKTLVVEGETFSYFAVTRSVEQLSGTRTILPIPGTDSFAILPPDFGDYLREWAEENLEESQDLFCFSINRNQYRDQCQETAVILEGDDTEGLGTVQEEQVSLLSPVEGLTLLLYLNTQGVVEVEVSDISSDISIFFGFGGDITDYFSTGILETDFEEVERSNVNVEREGQQNRFVLASDGGGTTETYHCGYLDESCTFLTDGCVVKWLDDSIPYCSCDHLSNFGLLFLSDSKDSWTTLRILSLSLLFAVWFFMFIFFLIAHFFPEQIGMETFAEKSRRVLGTHLPDDEPSKVSLASASASFVRFKEKFQRRG